MNGICCFCKCEIRSPYYCEFSNVGRNDIEASLCGWCALKLQTALNGRVIREELTALRKKVKDYTVLPSDYW